MPDLSSVFILWRSWITFTAIIATVLIVLALLSSLQHNALYSDLIRQRLSVVAQTPGNNNLVSDNNAKISGKNI